MDVWGSQGGHSFLRGRLCPQNTPSPSSDPRPPPLLDPDRPSAKGPSLALDMPPPPTRPGQSRCLNPTSSRGTCNPVFLSTSSLPMSPRAQGQALVNQAPASSLGSGTHQGHKVSTK